MSIRFFAAAIAAACAGAAAATSTPAGWTDDFEAAKAQAAKEGKLLLVDFSGSDWCGWCKKLDREVFAKPEFLEGAKKDFVLVMVDSPNDKSLLSEKAAKQNPELLKKYSVGGFPTVMVMDADGNVLETTGYRDGGPVPYLEHLAEIKKSSAAIVALKKEIKGMKKGSPARLAKIDAAFADAGDETLAKHANYINELLANDPDGKYAARYPYVKFVMPLERKLSNTYGKLNRMFREKLSAFRKSGKKPSQDDFAAIRKEIDPEAKKLFEELLAEAGKVKAQAPASAKKRIEKFERTLKTSIKRIDNPPKRGKAAKPAKSGK